MPSEKRKPMMTARERAIWNAVFAAEYTREFHLFADARGFDVAAEETSAETAITVADVAVEKLRAWNREEKAGIRGLSK